MLGSLAFTPRNECNYMPKESFNSHVNSGLIFLFLNVIDRLHIFYFGLQLVVEWKKYYAVCVLKVFLFYCRARISLSLDSLNDGSVI